MSEKIKNTFEVLRIYFLIVAVVIGLIGIGYINMLYNNQKLPLAEQLAEPDVMASIIQQSTYSVLVVASAITVYAIRKHNRLAFMAGVVALIYDMGYLITYKNTLDIAVWASIAIVVIGITLNISELIKPCKTKTWFKIPKHQYKGTGG